MTSDEYKRERRRRKRQTKKWFKRVFRSKALCSVCGKGPDVVKIQYHHKDPDKKFDSISHLVSRGYAKGFILSELSKCVPVCPGCHKKLDKEIAEKR